MYTSFSFIAIASSLLGVRANNIFNSTETCEGLEEKILNLIDQNMSSDCHVSEIKSTNNMKTQILPFAVHHKTCYLLCCEGAKSAQQIELPLKSQSLQLSAEGDCENTIQALEELNRYAEENDCTFNSEDFPDVEVSTLCGLICSGVQCSCGYDYEPCCEWHRCAGGYVCNIYDKCEACGDEYEPCCEWHRCAGGYVCDIEDKCKPCGGYYEPCCAPPAAPCEYYYGDDQANRRKLLDYDSDSGGMLYCDTSGYCMHYYKAL